MLENLHVISNNKERGDFNFWAEEIYSHIDFSEACIDVSLLLNEGLCRIVKSDEEKNEE